MNQYQDLDAHQLFTNIQIYYSNVVMAAGSERWTMDRNNVTERMLVC